MKAVLQWAFGLCCGMLALAFLWEVGSVLFPCNVRPEHPELFLMFGGRAEERVKAGLALAQQLKPHAIMLSDSSPEAIAGYVQAWGCPAGVEWVYEPYATNTVENALYSKALIERHGFKQVLLVVPWYHMPRASVLAHWALWGSHVKLQTCVCIPRPSGWWHQGEFWVEIVKFWPSMARMLWRTCG